MDALEEAYQVFYKSGNEDMENKVKRVYRSQTTC